MNIIAAKPRGKTSAPIILSKPGAFSSYHGEVRAISIAAHPKLKRQPADTAERNTLSGRIFAFFSPVRETSLIASAGEFIAVSKGDVY
mgnify:CR=1 FL=1